jgi:hypothetical protein
VTSAGLVVDAPTVVSQLASTLPFGKVVTTVGQILPGIRSGCALAVDWSPGVE